MFYLFVIFKEMMKYIISDLVFSGFLREDKEYRKYRKIQYCLQYPPIKETILEENNELQQ